MHLLLLLATWACLVPKVFCYDATQLLSEIPSCAASCLISQVQSSTCGLDVECLCSDAKLQADVKACVQNNCLPIESLATLNATSIACNYPVRDRHRQFDILAIVLCSITGIVVILRFFEKIRYEHKFQPEDCLVAFCFALTLTNTITCTIGLSGNGLGRDTWKITPAQLTTYLQYLYIGQTIYATEVFVTKICVALFYLRIFPSVGVQRLLWGTIGFSVLCTIVFDILAVAQCRPVSFFWQGWDKLHEGACIGVNPLGWAIAAVSIIMDFWMLAIPLLQLFKLQMKWQRKVAVAIMFLVGTFVTVVSVIRLRYLISFGNSSNPTWDSFETIYWTSIETNVGIWCICLPDLRVLIRKVFPKIRTCHDSSSNNTPYSSGPRSRHRGKSNNVSVHTHETYKGKVIQGYRTEHSSSTAELVELSDFGVESPNSV